MKKFYVKYRILLNGLNIIGDYKIDGFTIKDGYFKEDCLKEKSDIVKSGMYINFNSYLISCLCDYENRNFKFLELDNYDVYEVDDDIRIDENNFEQLININPKIVEKIKDLERKMRLMLNVPLLFQIIRILFYDDIDGKILFCIQNNKSISFWNRSEYNLNPEELHNNSRFKFDFNYMKNLESPHFKRSIELYNSSFESEDISIRYIIIFSSLEAIFNLDGKYIKENIAKFSAMLLSKKNRDYDIVYNDMKSLYKKRCDFIHGKDINPISESDEKLLRLYARKIIIIYWSIVMQTQKTAADILKYLNNNGEIDIQIKLIVTALNSKDFASQQFNLIKEIEEECKISIPDELKRNLLESTFKI